MARTAKVKPPLRPPKGGTRFDPIRYKLKLSDQVEIGVL